MQQPVFFQPAGGMGRRRHPVAGGRSVPSLLPARDPPYAEARHSLAPGGDRRPRPLSTTPGEAIAAGGPMADDFNVYTGSIVLDANGTHHALLHRSEPAPARASTVGRCSWSCTRRVVDGMRTWQRHPERHVRRHRTATRPATGAIRSSSGTRRRSSGACSSPRATRRPRPATRRDRAVRLARPDDAGSRPSPSGTRAGTSPTSAPRSSSGATGGISSTPSSREAFTTRYRMSRSLHGPWMSRSTTRSTAARSTPPSRPAATGAGSSSAGSPSREGAQRRRCVAVGRHDVGPRGRRRATTAPSPSDSRRARELRDERRLRRRDRSTSASHAGTVARRARRLRVAVVSRADTARAPSGPLSGSTSPPAPRNAVCCCAPAPTATTATSSASNRSGAARLRPLAAPAHRQRAVADLRRRAVRHRARAPLRPRARCARARGHRRRRPLRRDPRQRQVSSAPGSTTDRRAGSGVFVGEGTVTVDTVRRVRPRPSDRPSLPSRSTHLVAAAT